MPKIAFVGAGSTVFTRNLVGDILSLPELRDDTDVRADGHRRRAPADGRDRHRAADRRPRRRRLGRGHHRPPRGARRRRLRRHLVPGRRLQAVDGDRLRGAQALRAAPDDRRHARRRRDHARAADDPGAARRLPRPRGALARTRCCSTTSTRWRCCAGRSPRRSSIRTVGLCHSVQHTAGELAADLGLPAGELDYHVAGINHVAFFLRLEHEGEDLYPALRERRRRRTATASATSCSSTSATSSPSPPSTSPSTSPWFIKDGREDLIERFNVPLDEYPRRCERQIAEWDGAARRARGGGRSAPSAAHEYGADIIRACETGEPFTFNGNVPNRCGGRAADRQPARPTAASRCRASRRRDGHRAAAGRRAPAPARGADADQRQRPGPDRRGRADRPPRGGLPGGDARPAHRRRAVAGRDPRLWSTICSRPTASGSRARASSSTT